MFFWCVLSCAGQKTKPTIGPPFPQCHFGAHGLRDSTHAHVILKRSRPDLNDLYGKLAQVRRAGNLIGGQCPRDERGDRMMTVWSD